MAAESRRPDLNDRTRDGHSAAGRLLRSFAAAVLVLGSLAITGGVSTASAAPIPAAPTVSSATGVPGDDGSVGASISAGRFHTCAVRADGTAKCWGDSTISLGLLNLFFPLNPVSVDVQVGVEIPDDLGTVTSVAAGDWQTCAVRSDGTVRCWGTFGEAYPPPADLGTVRAIDGGGFHTCAVRTDGLARCWGSDFVGLQTGGPSPMTVPADLGTVQSISTSTISSCAVRTDGTVRCWGSDLYGGVSVPADLGTVRAVSVGDLYSCALRTDGTVRCWGTAPMSDVPADLGPVISLSSGGAHSCAIRTDGSTRCWGGVNEGQIEVPADLGPAVAVAVGGTTSCAATIGGQLRCWGGRTLDPNTGELVTQPRVLVPDDLGTVTRPTVSAGAGHTCGVRTDTTVRCWGDATFAAIPADLGPSTTVSSGFAHSCAVRSVGNVRCWGADGSGQSTPPADLGAVTSVSAGGTHSCALRTDGTVRCWGDAAPAAVPGDLGPAAAVSSGFAHTCAVRIDGTARCWGADDSGQSTVPADLGTVTAITAGFGHTCAIRTDGTARCWGLDDAVQSTVPSDLGPVTAITAGDTHTCAVRADGTVRCWGANGSGQSVPPADLGAVSSVSAGFGTHTCAVRTTGTIRCWGVDAGGPGVVFGATPPLLTNQPTASVEFSTVDQRASVACTLDGVPVACSSPLELSGLADGPHELLVVATSPEGLATPPARLAWTVDSVGPAVAITSAPPGSTQSTAATFGFTVEESSGPVNITCRLDGAEPSVCTDTATYSDLPAGTRRWEVTATDLAGNATTAIHTWTITAQPGGDGGGDPDPDDGDPDPVDPGPGTDGGTPDGGAAPTVPPPSGSTPTAPSPAAAAAAVPADVKGATVTANTGATSLALTGAPLAGALTSALALLFMGAALWLSSLRRQGRGPRSRTAASSGS